MGQYYRVINIDKKEQMTPHQYDQGAKLMEHSYLGNSFVGAVTSLLKKEWKGDRVVWIGDYFDAGEIAGIPSWESLDDFTDIKPKAQKIVKGFLNNDTKKISVDLSHCTRCEPGCEGEDAWPLHPLPMLTACGNGRGGGDYNIEDTFAKEVIGSWAGDNLSVTTKALYPTSSVFDITPNSVKFIKET